VECVIGTALTVFQGRAGDRNSRAMDGSRVLGEVLSSRLALPARTLGAVKPPLHLPWDKELAAARSELMDLAALYDELLAARHPLVSAIGRCAAGLATIPVVARHRPDACIVWFDAHGDSNTPTSVPNPYLGGMVISSACGMWESGLGAGLSFSNVVLVGARDLDPDEWALVDAGTLNLVRVGPSLGERLASAVGKRPVYMHLDCDVLEPGIVPTEYLSPGGFSLQDLREACEVLARNEVIGIEIAEFEATWPKDESPCSPAALLDALEPMLTAAHGSRV
jgi:arginase family enzyme